MVTTPLTIRPAQMQALGLAPRAGFHRQMAEHLRVHFPAECAALSDAAILAHIESVLNDAARWKLGSLQDQCRFLNLSIVFKAGFDTNPALPWIYEMLSNADVPSPSQRLSLLYDEALRRLRAPGGI